MATKKSTIKVTAKKPAPRPTEIKRPEPRPAPTRSSTTSPVSRAPATPARVERAPSARDRVEPATRRGDVLASLARRSDGTAVGTTPIGLPSPEWLNVEGAGGEKRRFRRVKKDLKIRLFAGREGKTALEASLRSEDMSLSGIFLRSTFFLPEGTEVKIEFDAPWGQTASARGIVARVSRGGAVEGFGIRFTELDEGALTDLVCIFVGDHIQHFVTSFSRHTTKNVDTVLLAEAILAWELERLRNMAP